MRPTATVFVVILTGTLIGCGGKGNSTPAPAAPAPGETTPNRETPVATTDSKNNLKVEIAKPKVSANESSVPVPADPAQPIAPVKAPGYRPPTPPVTTDPLQPHLVLDAGGHTATVQRIALSPDGRRVITASRDATVRVWDVQTGETLRTFRFPRGPGQEGIVQALALSPDGRWLAAAVYPLDKGKDGFPVFVLEPETGRVVSVVKGHSNNVTALAFSRDGHFMATGSGDKVIGVYDTRSWKPLAGLRGHTGSISRIAFSPDGKRLVSVSYDHVALLWTGDQKQRPFFELRDGTHEPESVAWSPDGQTVAVGNSDGTISLWNPDATYRKTLLGLRNNMLWLAFTPDSREILQGGIAPGNLNSERYSPALVDIATGKERSRFESHTNVVMDGCLSRDGKLALTSGGNDREVLLWRTEDATLVQTFVGRGNAAWAVGWSADGQSIGWGNTNLVGGERNNPPLERTFHLDQLRFGDRPTNDFRRAVLTHGSKRLELTPGGEMAIKEGDRTIMVYRDTEASASDNVYCFTWLPSGLIVVGSQFGLHLFDPAKNRIVHSYAGSTDTNLAVAPSPDGRLFLSVSADMILRIWDVEKRDPLLSLFFAGTDWIAWTEEGIYAASPNGERMMGWQVNTGGADGLGTAYAAAQFRKSLRLPEVVRRVVSSGSVSAALARSGIGADAAPQVTRVLPPVVALTSPSGLEVARLRGPKFEVKAKARSVGTSPVVALRLLVNGRPYSGGAGVRAVAEPRLGEVEGTWSVDLPPGLYNLAVAAESRVSVAVSEPVAVQVGTTDADERPDLYVLAVGINDYPDPMKLHFAAPDADAITKAFREFGGRAFRRVEVKLLKDKEATRKHVEQGLDWLAGKATHRDVTVVFFSGHGSRDEKGNLYLITADVDPKDVAGTCLPGDALKRRLAEIPGRVIAMLDACHSGAAADRPDRPAATDDLIRELVTEEYGVVVMSSSQGWEYSLESPTVGQGFFTAGLVEGLSGKADFNRDGLVFLNELDSYAARRARELSGGRQNPVTARPVTVRSFPLAQPRSQ
jgi:WD40 repeat protein